MSRRTTDHTRRQPRAAIYTRVSTLAQEEEGSSLETQLEACIRHAAQGGFEVDDNHVYREVYTGTELWARPRLTALREAVRTHQVDAVVAYAIDRLSRDPVHLGVLLSEAEHVGVEVLFVTEPLDHSPEGQLIRFVRGYAAKVEHEKIKERTIRGKRARLLSGRLLPGCKALYGYRWRDDTRGAYEPDPLTAWVVQRIYKEAAEGRTLCQIAERLTSEGVPKPTGRGRPRWAHQSIRWILKTPHYAGEVNWWRRNRSANKAAGRPVDEWRPLDEQVAMPAECIPALVDKETFDIVQERLRLNQERSARNNREPEATLLRGGFVRCGYCGDSMAALHARPKRRQAAFYKCSRGMKYPRDCTQHGISATVLDPAIWGKIEEILLRPEIIAGELARMENQAPATDVEELERIERALATIERQQRNLVDQLAEQGQVVAALITQKLASLNDQRKSLEDNKVSLLTRKANQEAAQSRLHELEAWCSKVAERLGSFSYQEKRAALDALGVTVKVWRTDHTPRWEAEASIPLGDSPDPLLLARQEVSASSRHFAAHTYPAAGRWSISG